jgi:hypothetical protein
VGSYFLIGSEQMLMLLRADAVPDHCPGSQGADSDPCGSVRVIVQACAPRVVAALGPGRLLARPDPDKRLRVTTLTLPTQTFIPHRSGIRRRPGRATRVPARTPTPARERPARSGPGRPGPQLPRAMMGAEVTRHCSRAPSSDPVMTYPSVTLKARLVTGAVWQL